ncbi:MAG: phosphoglycerate kinase [Alphaproteobacteria bacterium]|nr:phosphoglycerate kinase [Alphaproteobacteria bacterium]
MNKDPLFLTLSQIPLKDKTVLLRADLNVPVADGKVSDTTRLQRILPTLRELANSSAKTVILSHFGRPEGRRDDKYSLRPVAKELEKIWGAPIGFVDDCIGNTASKAVKALKPGEILVLENTRFHEAETKNSSEFASEIAKLGDVYINDAFSVSHRAHASTEALARLMPRAAGRLMEEEINALESALTNPARPLAAIVGGSKISTKLELLENLVAKVDYLVLGGGMANTFLAAQGLNVAKSLIEKNMIETAKRIEDNAKKHNCEIVLPCDAVVSTKMEHGAHTDTVSVDKVPAGHMILDIGPDTVNKIDDVLSLCKTIVWNGPLGAFEFKPFDSGTNAIAHIVGDLTKENNVMSIAGGGDTVGALINSGVIDELSYVSVSGGAFLEWLEGKTLPGIEALK